MNIILILILGLILLAVSVILLIISCFDTIIEFKNGFAVGITLLFISMIFLTEAYLNEKQDSKSDLVQQIIIKK